MKSRIMALGVFALLAAPAAHATTYFDSFSGNILQYYDGPQSDGTYVMADSFTAATPDFTSVSLALFDDNPSTDTGSIMVFLVPDDGSGGGNGVAGFMADEGGIEIGTVNPANLQGSSVAADPASVTLTTLTFSPSLIPATLDQEYWVEVVASEASQVEFLAAADGTGIGTTNQGYYNDAGGYSDDSSGPYAAIVSSPASAPPTDTPEPATIAILGAGLLGLGYSRRRLFRG